MTNSLLKCCGSPVQRALSSSGAGWGRVPGGNLSCIWKGWWEFGRGGGAGSYSRKGEPVCMAGGWWWGLFLRAIRNVVWPQKWGGFPITSSCWGSPSSLCPQWEGLKGLRAWFQGSAEPTCLPVGCWVLHEPLGWEEDCAGCHGWSSPRWMEERMLRTCLAKNQEENLVIKEAQKLGPKFVVWMRLDGSGACELGTSMGWVQFLHGGGGPSPGLEGKVLGVTDGMDVETKMKRPCESWTLRLSNRTVHCPRV